MKAEKLLHLTLVKNGFKGFVTKGSGFSQTIVEAMERYAKDYYESKVKKLNKPAVIGSAFVSIFDRFGVTDYNEHDTIEDAIKSLEYGSDEGMIMDIAVIETSTKKMVWYQKFLGKPECQAKVDRFVKYYL